MHTVLSAPALILGDSNIEIATLSTLLQPLSVIVTLYFVLTSGCIFITEVVSPVLHNTWLFIGTTFVQLFASSATNPL